MTIPDTGGEDSMAAEGEEMNYNPLDDCIEEQEAPCRCACPLEFDAREFVSRVKQGLWGTAYSMYHNAVLFPGIVSCVCPAPCQGACARALQKDAVPILAVERTAQKTARRRNPPAYNMPLKPKAAAVISADLVGLTCALRLREKGYPVAVYEPSSVLCSSIQGMMPEEEIEQEIQLQFSHAPCEIYRDADLRVIDISAYDVICDFTGFLEARSEDDRVLKFPVEHRPIEQIAEGKAAAEAVDWFFSTGSRKGIQKIKAPQNIDTAIPRGELPELDKSQAREEANRCTGCGCSACLQQCALLRQYGGTIAELKKGVGVSLNYMEHVQSRDCMREIGGCNFCGFCEEICPKHINIGEYLKRARTELCAQGVLPPAHHDFWMRDLAFSESVEAALLYAPQPRRMKRMFFPGCQLGGSDPEYVTGLYDLLLSLDGSTGIGIGCCGAPAEWAGDREKFLEIRGGIRDFWRKQGQPEIILACPYCYKNFRENMQEIPVKMYFELVEIRLRKHITGTAAVYDPCAMRRFPEIRNRVRRLLEAENISLEELKYSGAKAQCCSWGGHAYTVNPNFVKTQVAEQIAMDENPYITYCINCTDIFRAKGKKVCYLGDLVLGRDTESRNIPTVSDRRENRRKLRRMLVDQYHIADNSPAGCGDRFFLHMSDALKKKLTERLILEEDAIQVIEEAERSGKYIIDVENGHRFAHRKISHMTYWAEYTMDESGGCTLYNAYSHRMMIVNEDKKSWETENSSAEDAGKS